MASSAAVPDPYATLGVPPTATTAEIKRAYRKLARKHHPDLNKEPDAEARFKDVAQAYEAVHDPERRAAHDEAARRQHSAAAAPQPSQRSAFSDAAFGGDDGSGLPDGSADFIAQLLRRHAGGWQPQRPAHRVGEDQHAQVTIDLEEAYRGTRRTVSLRIPVSGADGRTVLQDRQLEVTVPKGMREGQQLRLPGQAGGDTGDAPAGDLYLEIVLRPHRRFQVDGRDVFVKLPVSPWEAALGATVTAATPDGNVALTIPPGSSSGRRLRLRGKGLPSQPPGDLYAELVVTVPPATTPQASEAYAALARACAGFDPRAEGPA